MAKRILKGRLLLILCAAMLMAAMSARAEGGPERFLKKAALLKAQVVTENTIEALGDAPAGEAGHAVFFSVCDGVDRAQVFSGTGETLAAAWDAAEQRAAQAVAAQGLDPLWVKADVATECESVSADSFQVLTEGVSGFDFDGLALDGQFQTAFLEGELNGWGIYDYKEGALSLQKLNRCLEARGRTSFEALPSNVLRFAARGWFCDGDDAVYPLIQDGADYGRREISPLDREMAAAMIDSASRYLVTQVNPDGSFVYGRRGQTDKALSSYNIVRHSGTVWSLVCRYRMFPDNALPEIIDRVIAYMLSQLKYDESGAAYLYEAKSDEIKLGGNGIAVVALTEYMDVFHSDKYRDVSVALGEGILNMMDKNTGVYWHVLNGDFSPGDEFRTVYYDGEATFALARLYGLTGDERWLDAACRAVERFIADDYTQYRDHWVAYSLNEVTKYVEDRQDFYDFALANATNNYERIEGRARCYPTNLELLVSTFETWQRMTARGADTGDFDVRRLLEVIEGRARRQLSSYCFPEYAMYMANPTRFLGTFAMRDDRFRVRIDDVQHNIGGYYLYWKNFDAMVEAGLDPAASVQP